MNLNRKTGQQTRRNGESEKEQMRVQTGPGSLKPASEGQADRHRWQLHTPEPPRRMPRAELRAHPWRLHYEPPRRHGHFIEDSMRVNQGVCVSAAAKASRVCVGCGRRGWGGGFSRMLAGGRGVTVKERTEEAQSRVGSGLAWERKEVD